MTEKKSYSIRTRPLSSTIVALEMDTSAGISYNGTTHDPPKPDNKSEPRYRHFKKEGEPISTEYKRAMVEGEEKVLELLPEHEREKARRRIAEYRKELGIPSTP